MLLAAAPTPLVFLLPCYMKQLWCSTDSAGCQPAPLGNSFGAIWCSKAGSGCQPALLGCSFCSQQKPVRAGSPHRVEATLVLIVSKAGAGRQPAPLKQQRWCSRCQRPLWAATLHCLDAALVKQILVAPGRTCAATPMLLLYLPFLHDSPDCVDCVQVYSFIPKRLRAHQGVSAGPPYMKGLDVPKPLQACQREFIQI